MTDTYHDGDPTNVKKLTGNDRPLEQDWPEGGTQGHAKEDIMVTRPKPTWESEPEDTVALLRPRKTPAERKAEALEQAYQHARRAVNELELSLDELSLDAHDITVEEYQLTVPVLVAYLDRVERRHRARAK